MSLTTKRLSRRQGLLPELLVLTAVLVLTVFSWRVISDVATAVYMQTAPQGDPPLQTISVPGPEPHPGGNGRGAYGPPSVLGHYGYFWSERAFHYRTMLMFSGGSHEDPGLLSHDTWQQYPDGVNAWREYTLLMEPVYGWLFQIFGDQSRPPVEFLLGLIPLLHVLLIPLLFFASRSLGLGRVASLAGVIFYAGCTLGFQRMTGSLLLKEDFALLLLAGFLVAHARSAGRHGWGWPVAGALLLALFLASWHLSQFLALALLGTAAVWHVGAEDPDRRTPWVYLLGAVVAGFTPSLWARGFLLGPLVAVLVSWLVTVTFVRHSPRRRVVVLLALVVVLGGGSLLNRMFSGDYSHVMGLLLAKFRHGFVRPDDPDSLPFAVRIFWAPPFNTPTLAELQAKLGWHTLWLPVLVLWSAVVLLRRKVRGHVAALVACQLIMLGGYLLIERLGVVFLVFAALTMAVFAGSLQRWLRGRGWSERRAAVLVLVLVAATPVGNLWGNMAPMLHISHDLQHGGKVRLGANDQAKWADATELMQWITRNTPGPGSRVQGPPAGFLAEVGMSPQLLLYCQRPMALNSQFENTKIRARYEQFLQLLYGADEQALADFARKLEVQYLVIDRNMASLDGPGSLSWVAGRKGYLDLDMVVARMTMDTGKLSYFRPVFDNQRYRVLALAGARLGTVVSSHSCSWNSDQFTVADGKLVDLPGDRLRLNKFYQAMSDLQTRQRQLLAGSDRGSNQPSLMSLHRQLVQARMNALLEAPAAAREAKDRAGRLANAIAARLSGIEPLTGQPLGKALEGLVGSTQSPRQGFLGWLATNKGEPLHHATAGQLLALVGRYDEAAEQFRIAAEFFNDSQKGALGRNPDPMVLQLWLERAWWTFAAGKDDMAAELARNYLATITSPTESGQVVAVLKELSAISPVGD